MGTGKVRRGGGGGEGETGRGNGKGGNNVRKCVICEVLLDLFFPT